MLSDHGDYAIEDYYKVLYCMGVFSFKFHDYEMAIHYFRECEKQILNKFPEPYNSMESDLYVKAKILMSYSLEYNGYLNQGPKQAIDNILDSPLNDTEKIWEKFINKIPKQSKEIVSDFFRYYPSKIYTFASTPMQKEILHLLAHCLSEYANSLKANEKNCEDYKKIYLWEKLANSFISALGAEMVTCKAIISSEHGQYWPALEEMKHQYSSLPENEKRKKAELAFYIYYFSNQIGLDQNNKVEDYKRYFLDFAEEENGDTKVYAWIVQFREKLAEALQVSGKEGQKLLALESFIKEAKRHSTNQRYLHPQIIKEKNRLLLAYQILRSYLILNEKKSTHDQDIDNGLFEKCVLFSKQNSTDKLIEKKVDWSDKEHVIRLHNVCLCVVGLTEDVHSLLENEFCIKIPFFDDAGVHDHKVIICTSEEQLCALEKADKSHLTLFIYGSDKYYSKIREIVDENVCIKTDLIKTFKIAYIQEILEQCYQFSYRWDEFFIMAPITDNSTFAFQNQGIEKFLEIKNSTSNEKELFSEDNGYVTNEFGILASVQVIPYARLSVNGEAEITRVFYFTGNCLYFYQEAKGGFTPYKVLRNLDRIKNVAYKLRKKSKN